MSHFKETFKNRKIYQSPLPLPTYFIHFQLSLLIEKKKKKRGETTPFFQQQKQDTELQLSCFLHLILVLRFPKSNMI